MGLKVLKGVFFSFMVCIALLAGAAIFLTSTAGSRWILTQVKSTLSKNLHTEFEYTAGALELTSGFHFKDLKIHQKSSTQELSLSLKSLDCDYTIFWWSRKLQIKKLTLLQPQIQIEATSQTIPEKSEPTDFSQWIEKPPLSIEVQQFTVTELSMLDQRVAGKTQIKPTDFEGAFALRPHHLSTSGHFKTDLVFADPDLSLHLSSNAKWETSLEVQNREWHYDIKTGDLNAVIDQLVLKQTAQSKVQIDSQDLSLHTDAEKKNITLHYGIHGLSMPTKLSKKVNAEWSATLQGKDNFRETALQSQILLEKIPLFSLNGKWEGLNHFHFQSDWIADSRLARFIPSAAMLKKTGTIRGSLQWDGKIEHPLQLESQLSVTIPQFRMDEKTPFWSVTLAGTLDWIQKEKSLSWLGQLDARNSTLGQWTAKTVFKNKDLESSSEIELTESTHDILLEPVHFSHHFRPTELHVEIKAPKLHFEHYGNSENLNLALDGQSSDFAKGNDYILNLGIQQSRFAFDSSQTKNSPLSALEGLNASARVKLTNGSMLSLEVFKTTSNQSLLTISGNGTGNLKTQEYQSHLNLLLDIPEAFPALRGTKLKGIIAIPVNLSMVKNRDLNLRGAIELHHIDGSNGEYSFQDLSGRIPFEEKMIYQSGSKIRFTELITQNPFERVNFERLRPLLQGADQLSIKSIRWEEKSYGPFVGFISLNQNMLFIHQFDLDLGSGRISGELFFDSYPSNLQLGILSRLTHLNLSEVLPKHYLFKVPSGSKTISGRSGFVINLNKGSMDGRIDVTEIGSSQLVTLINLLDPRYEDEKMNRIRGILGVAYPTAVGVAFADGYMDMDIDLKAVGLATRESLRGVPISHFILQKTQETPKP